MSLIALSVCIAAAQAQELAPDRPNIPGASIAAESGPGVPWINPANMAYDPDWRAGTFLMFGPSRNMPDIAATVGSKGSALAVHRLHGTDGDAQWSLDYAASIKLPRRFAIGGRAAWHLVPESGNYVAYDLGASWRPLPWIGMSAVARNLGAPSSASPTQSGLGIALRPFRSAVVLGADRLHTSTEGGSDLWRGTLRLRPTEGLYFRASADSAGTFGAGLEFFFGGSGAGGWTAEQNGEWRSTAYLGTDEPGESLYRKGRKVPRLTLDATPPYEPEPRLFAKPVESWLTTLDRLQQAVDDPAVRGLTIAFEGAGLPWARAKELRTRIETLEKSGKPVIAYLRGGSRTVDYYVASAAQTVVLHPAADLYLTGISTELMQLRGLFDKMGVEPQFVRRAEYKSAVEQYTRAEPSPPSLEQTNALLDDLSTELITAIAEGRHKSVDEVRAWIDGGPWTAREALAKGLIDGTAYPDQIDDRVEAAHGKLATQPDLSKLPDPHSGWTEPAEIAVIYVEGVINSGRSSRGGLLGGPSAGSDSIVDALDHARETDRIKAVVLRVDSPGGSSFASDEIHRAVERLKSVNKPVVVSMGSVAASGGYYIACGADAIWAEPNTLTGSIGVFSGKFAINGLFEKLGITTTEVARGNHAGIDSSTRRWSDDEVARMETLVQAVYDDFKARVAAGRHLDPAKVEDVARGRVWSGRRAQEVGLVDQLGDLPQAIQDAKVRAGLAADRPVAIVRAAGNTGPDKTPATWVRALVPEIGAETEFTSLLKHAIGPVAPLLRLGDSAERVWMLAPWLATDGELVEWKLPEP